MATAIEDVVVFVGEVEPDNAKELRRRKYMLLIACCDMLKYVVCVRYQSLVDHPCEEN